MPQPVDVLGSAEAAFRREHGRIIASLIRLCGSFDRAEEAMQEAFAAALRYWAERGVPDRPAAWITTTAYRKLIDARRRERTRQEKQSLLEQDLAAAMSGEEVASEEMPSEIPDDRLRLIFTCCHPALNREAQVALTLRSLGGLTTPEIARAFLVAEPTLAQRLVRAKQKIRDANIPYEVPPAHVLRERLEPVQAVVYLIFNEGYITTAGEHLVRADLCAEAIRLRRTLCELLPKEPENLGLLALMLLHDPRRNVRVNYAGELVTLEEQDRSLWDQDQIREGARLVEDALRLHAVGPYQLQAAIGAVHGQAAKAEETDWAQIALLYNELAHLSPTSVIDLNHAVAVAMSQGLDRGLFLIDNLGRSGELDGYYLFHAARGDILRRLGRRNEAGNAYREALALTTNHVERTYLARRLREVTQQ